MNRASFILGVSLLATSAFGQGGSWYIGGTGSYSSSSSDADLNPTMSSWTFNPEVGTFFNAKWSAGLTLGLGGSTTSNDDGDLSESSQFLPSVYGRRWWSAGDKLGLFAGLDVAFGVVVFRQRGRIQKALHRSDELLLNILPEEVAEELKAKGHADAKHFDQVTILFTDFKGFTEASERLSPQELVEELNTCFKAFDHIITSRGIEKIKTIGDAYMCAGGLPVPASSTPAGVVHAALEMQAFMVARKKERDASGKPAFEMRVGIHTGPVVAGIVGVKKFAYDIWGDTVNTASRMESSGEVGQVNISEATYALVKHEPGLTFTPRGKVQAKGKGEMEMYFVSRSLGED